MSDVTNVILAVGVCETEDEDYDHTETVIRFDSRLKRVDQHAGGGKAFECTVFMAAYNYLDLDSMLTLFAEIPWRDRDEVQLMVKGQDDEHFKIYVPGDLE